MRIVARARSLSRVAAGFAIGLMLALPSNAQQASGNDYSSDRLLSLLRDAAAEEQSRYQIENPFQWPVDIAGEQIAVEWMPIMLPLSGVGQEDGKTLFPLPDPFALTRTDLHIPAKSLRVPEDEEGLLRLLREIERRKMRSE